MDRKGDRPSKVPAGTFGPSTPPPPPPEAIAASLRPAPLLEPERTPSPMTEERRRFTSTLVDGAGAASRASVPPPVPDEARRSPSTLVGHTPAPPPMPHVSQPPGAAVLSPPKWQGAKAYLEGREPKPRVSSIPNMPAVTAAGAHASAMPSKVTTKLGTPTAMQRQAAAASTSTPPSIESAPDESHESPAAPTRGAASEVLDDLSVEELSSEEMTELRASNPPAAAPLAAGPSARPAQQEAASEPMRELPVLPPLLVQSADLEARPLAPEPMPEAASARAAEPAAVVARSAHEHAPVAARPVSARAPRPAKVEPPSSVAGAAFASSLAPSETAVRGDDSGTRFGVVLLAAIALLSVGGWWLTRGGFQRGSRTAAAAAQVANAQPAAPPAVPAPAAALQQPELGDVAPPPTATLPSAPVPAAPLAAAPTPPAAAPAEAPTTAPAEAAAPPARTTPRPAVSRRTAPTPPTPPLEPPTSPKAATTAAAVAPPQPAAVNPGPLPPTPSREDVVSALEPLRAAVQQCAGALRGVAQLDVTVANNGSVTHAVVAGDFAGTPEGSCIARIARSAKFSPFERPRFRVIYPYAL